VIVSVMAASVTGAIDASITTCVPVASVLTNENRDLFVARRVESLVDALSAMYLAYQLRCEVEGIVILKSDLRENVGRAARI
jgi:hypothetical protein